VPLLAVSAWKHQQLVDAQAKILGLALEKDYVSPADFAEDELAPNDRQGVASNAWNALRAAGLIDRLALGFNNPERGIFAGRIRNPNEAAKGRWVAVYFLLSRKLALAWLDRNSPGRGNAKAEKVQQLELLA